MAILKTDRLILRPWREEDLAPFAALNSDPRVMEYFPSTLTKEESDRLAKRVMTNLEKKGWGWWAAEVPGISDFIGFIGLNELDSVHFAPAVEVGWRLAYDYWGKGYATEGAKACLEYGFMNLGLNEIVSFTALPNTRSIAVMKKLGLTRNPDDDFDHPKIPEGHPLRRHVLYRISKNEWLANQIK